MRTAESSWNFCTWVWWNLVPQCHCHKPTRAPRHRNLISKRHGFGLEIHFTYSTEYNFSLVACCSICVRHNEWQHSRVSSYYQWTDRQTDAANLKAGSSNVFIHNPPSTVSGCPEEHKHKYNTNTRTVLHETTAPSLCGHFSATCVMREI